MAEEEGSGVERVRANILEARLNQCAGVKGIVVGLWVVCVQRIAFAGGRARGLWQRLEAAPTLDVDCAGYVRFQRLLWGPGRGVGQAIRSVVGRCAS
jgi:hypothetical protein